MSDNNLVYGLDQIVVAPGSLGIGTIKDEGKVRFITAGAGPANVVRVRARIVGQSTWVTLTDLTGNINELVDIYGYDQLEVMCLVFNPANGLNFRILASSFDGTSMFFSTPSGDIDGQSVISFISSNSSVDISANSLTGEIDFQVTGGSTPPHVASFVSGDWVSDSGQYQITVLAGTHLKGINPTVQIYEDVLGLFEEIEAPIELNTLGDITIIVEQTPDLRFSGKMIIS